ncbi:UDP-N-acetylmuramoyl-tripeptide--D-alanyl-D-alanine ligase [Moraxella sp. Tifton1]|uniref:UDP-N-acetylmuramoyl-tripeptide--D-alanyl-D- alanine ligase n=1 Tax=Moraxella oculi TaxID=2940516 RepID=UPI002011BABB|nr:UDP-N-acetylmuramoyl-tripeptide--D-alanyl-D-alanine ligase [Moraxella sp. Tifton1]MCL1623708.1 UDP-N-acetylmuramoyl-tripeptide--D-alanyl-D-alanine ligase [Moraxella sp. Tifton1]
MTTNHRYVWHKQNLQAATCGAWHGDFSGQSTKITTDTRTINEGDIFLAIHGENFDGHDFVNQAFEQGAVLAIVNQVVASNLPQLVVGDTKKALGMLGQYRRDDHPDLTVVALTGSAGKTTTKEMLGSILGQMAPTLITRGNLNNDLGVPMMLLDLTDEHRFAVMELGANHVGEIAHTSALVRPDVACVLNIGTAHLGEFGGRANIARAKAEIYSSLSSDGVAVVPFDDEFFEFLNESASQFTSRILSFGERSVPLSQASLSDDDTAMLCKQGVDSVLMMGDLFADDVDVANTYTNFTLNTNLHVDEIESLPVHLPFMGMHNVVNAQAAAACAYALGVPLELIVKGLESANPPKGRLTRVAFGQHTFIDDTYNANPTSMLAAAKVLEQEETTKILVLGDIFELGEAADDEHHRLGLNLAQLHIDEIFGLGRHMLHTVRGVNEIRPIATHFSDKDSLLGALNARLDSGAATVLFKGSRGMKMESLIDALMNA